MGSFDDAYKALNAAQRQAVDYIDGPILVVAGPGTGKTQLLSVRVANILQKTDTPPRNVLCLTFTETGAENMRERLTSLIGQAAYDVTVSTYHGFGRELITRFPEYFTETRLQNNIDELGQRQVVTGIIERLNYSNPLKQTRHHVADLIGAMSEVKRALLSSADLRLVAAENLTFIRQAGGEAEQLFESFVRMPKPTQAIPLFERLLERIAKFSPDKPANTRFRPLAQSAILSLRLALDEAHEAGSTKPLTSWKNDWLVRDGDNRLTFSGKLESERVEALAGIMDQYQATLADQGLFDYDDMIVRAIRALEEHDDMRFTLQEQYLYLLLDEFQDTNEAQLRLVELLTDNPANEGHPNVMAVGDDDQAIYAFQGALYSNLTDFLRLYRDVKVVDLTENYRSHPDILSTAQHVAEQIDERLYTQFNRSEKRLRASNKALPIDAAIERREFLSSIAEADWISRQIKQLVDKGTRPKDIAILAPRHKSLEPLVPYLNSRDIPTRYEKRENILDASVVKQLLAMSRLVLALQDNDETTADNLWPQVLSYDFWGIPTSVIWKLSWAVADSRAKDDAVSSDNTSWSKAMLVDDKYLRLPALIFLALANKARDGSGEEMLDYLTGSAVIDIHEKDLPRVYSPLRDYYTSTEMQHKKPEVFYETLSHLAVLRAKLREHQRSSETVLALRDIVNFADMYAAADERMMNTSPYSQATDSVQLMTVYKAKGLEFEHVFLVGLQDDIWGPSSRNQNNHITLPPNLIPIRHAGVTEDERLRILYVAITRAKFGLYLSSVAQTYSGQATKRLKYLREQEREDGSLADLVLPGRVQTVIRDDQTPPPLELLEHDWKQRHTDRLTEKNLRSLLELRLKKYRLSPTHLGEFLDLQYAGPERFFLKTVLRFPEAPTIDIQFGNAIHETLQWVQTYVTAHGTVPGTNEALAYFAQSLRVKKLPETRTGIEIERGEKILARYLAARGTQYRAGDRAEVSFKHEGVTIGDAQLSGKIDRLEIDHSHKTITVVDYKTGKSYGKWLNDPKLYKYRRQLVSYKILVEHASSFSGYTVTSGRLEYVEPDSNGRIQPLELRFSDDEVERTKKLMQSLWHHVQLLSFPSTSGYKADLGGIKKFEDDLIDGVI